MLRIKIDVLNAKEIADKLENLPEEVADRAVGDVQDFLLNVLRHGQPSRTFITRASAYPDVACTTPLGKQITGFFSWAQFKRVAALWSEGLIPYHRTQALSRGWKITTRGLVGYIVNDTPGAEFVLGEETQSRHEAMVGWKKPSQQIQEHWTKIEKIIDAAVKKAKRKLGLE